MTVLVLEGALLGETLSRAGDEDVIVVEHSATELERLEREVADPRVFYLIGDPEILPLPDRSVDAAVGEGVEPELRRVVRRN
jgi:ubiquinone/menaquinone biosynthesis C-methylase UbiE